MISSRSLPHQRAPQVKPFFSYVFGWPAITFFVASAIFTVYFISWQLDQKLIETCEQSPYQREHNPDNTIKRRGLQPSGEDGGEAEQTVVWILFPAPVRDFMFFWFTRVALCVLASAILFYSPHKLGHVLMLCVVFGSYFIGLDICEELKFRLSDTACHWRPNSVSGHAFFAIWAFLVFFYLLDKLEEAIAQRSGIDQQHKIKWNKDWTIKLSSYNNSTSTIPAWHPFSHPSHLQQRAQDSVMASEKEQTAQVKERTTLFYWQWIICGLMVWGLVVQLIYTYWYGYHSLQQMFLGATWAGVFASLTALAGQTILWTHDAIIVVSSIPHHHHRTHLE